MSLFVGALFGLTTVGALLPLEVGSREDHVVLTISATFVLGVLGAPGLLLVWASVLVALALRRAGRWLVGTAAAITVGFSVAHLTYAVLLDHRYPLRLSSGGDLALSWLVLAVAWCGTMSVRVVLYRLGGRDDGAGARGFDAFDSPLVPYLLPTVAGAPILAAGLALHRPEAPWSAFVLLLWCLPLYAASRFDLHRQHLAQQLRRDLAARRRLSALGEVTARMLHQSRHQAALMGWSIHRLRRLLDDPAASRELDVLAAAKQRIQDTFDRELLHEPVTPATAPALLGPVVADVCAQLEGKAEIVVTQAVEPGVVVPPALREVLFNLVDNAVDAAASQVRVVGRDGCVVVEDDGPGVPAQVAGRLGEPFVTTKPDGTGMGLAVAEALLAELDGRLGYERRDGLTRFTVDLPPFVEDPAPGEGARSSTT